MQTKRTISTSLQAVQALSPEYLQECFEYKPDTGTLVWRSRPVNHFSSEGVQKCFNSKWAGTEAGKKIKADERYRYVRITTHENSFILKVSHVVWRWHGESLPEGQIIDHKDGDSFNDRYENLRLCPQIDNMKNRRKSCSNTSGHTGVGRHGDGWSATIAADGHFYFLGKFETFDEAVLARRAGELKYFGEFARTKNAPMPPYELSYAEEEWINSIASL